MNSLLLRVSLASLAAIVFASSRPAGAASAALPSYLVLPPENVSENRALYWLGEALGESMERALTAAGADIATRDERRGIEREEMGLGPLNVATIATRLKEAEALNVDRIVFGSFTARQGTAWLDITVTLQVLDVAQLRRGPKKTVGPLPLEKLPSLQNAVAAALIEIESIPPPATGLPRAPTEETNRMAYESRMKSLLEETPDKQASYLLRSLESDPDYLRSRVELASLQHDADHPELALATLLARPLSGDPDTASSGERLTGELLLEASRPTGAVNAFRRALRWKEDSTIHLSLARALIFRGDLEIASAEVELARRLDPEDPELKELMSLLASPPPPMEDEAPPASNPPGTLPSVPR